LPCRAWQILAARKLAIADLIELPGMSEAQKRSYRADNKLALNAGWDRELLSLEMATSPPSASTSD
jgi:hypothetical protein